MSEEGPSAVGAGKGRPLLCVGVRTGDQEALWELPWEEAEGPGLGPGRQRENGGSQGPAGNMAGGPVCQAEEFAVPEAMGGP